MTDSTEYNSESGVTVELNKLVREIAAFAYNATEAQKKALLPLLKDPKIRELLKIGRQTDRRAHPRRPCSVYMYYTVEDTVLTGVMKNISAGGVFIKTITPAHVGQEIKMTFWPGDQETPMEAIGEIVRTAEDGLGVKFRTPPSEELKNMIESL